MIKLENIVKKHPVISTCIALKAFDLVVLGAVYYIWPEQTSCVLNKIYHWGKQSLPFVAVGMADCSKEIVNVCRYPNSLRTIYNLNYLI